MLVVAYRRDRDQRVREAYEGRFSERVVTYQRGVNVVEKRTVLTRPEEEYDRDYEYDTQRYSATRSYNDQDQRGYYSESTRTASVQGYHVESTHIRSIRRAFSPPRKEDSYSYYRASRDDVQRGGQIDMREDPEGFRQRGPYTEVRDRSPIRREAQPPLLMRSGSNISSRSYSPDRDKCYPPDVDKGYSYQTQQRRYEELYNRNKEPDNPRLLSHTTSASVDGSPLSSVSLKEDPPALLAKQEVVETVREEPDLTSEEDFKAHRSQTIAAKALEIEKLYMQDCETFGTVVKMLVAKEPSLDQLLETPLKENLVEIRERCLDDLRHFIKELDQVTQQAKPST